VPDQRVVASQSGQHVAALIAVETVVQLIAGALEIRRARRQRIESETGSVQAAPMLGLRAVRSPSGSSSART
jgi:hypothetical protein